jgi:hypothetical protein
MLTVGGIIYDEGLSARVESCGFGQLNYVKSSDEPFLISPPNLTLREIRHLDKELPLFGAALPSLPGVPDDDIRKYSELYRFFPNFAEAEL